MPFLTDAERAQIKLFDPENLPAFARMMEKPEDLGLLRDPAGEVNVLLQTTDWKPAIRPIFDEGAPLPVNTRLLNLAQHRRMYPNFPSDMRFRIYGSNPTRKNPDKPGDFTTARRILNNPAADAFLKHCQMAPAAFMENLDWLTSANTDIIFTTASGQSEINPDAWMIMGSLATHFGGTMFPDPAILRTREFKGRKTIQKMLERGVDMYQTPVGMTAYYHGLFPHVGDPTTPETEKSRPVVRYYFAYSRKGMTQG